MMRKKIICLVAIVTMLCCAVSVTAFADMPATESAALIAARENGNPNAVAVQMVSDDLMPLGGAKQATYNIATRSFAIEMNDRVDWSRSAKIFKGIGDTVVKNGSAVSASQATVYYKATVNFETADAQTLLGIIVGKSVVDEQNTRYYSVNLKPKASHIYGYNFINANAPASKKEEKSEQLSTAAKTYTESTDYVLEVLKTPESISVYVNGEVAATDITSFTTTGGTDDVSGILPAFGINVCQGSSTGTAATIGDFTMKYLDAEFVQVPSGASITKGTDIYEAGDVFSSGLATGAVLADGGGKEFVFGGSVQDFYPLDSAALSDATYKVNGEVKQIGELPIYFSADITLAALGADSWHGMGLLIGRKDDKTYTLRMQQNGACHVLDPNAGVQSNNSTGIVLAANGVYRAEMLRSNGKLSVWINGKSVFDNADIPSGLDNKIGVMFAGVGKGACVRNVKCYFTQNVEVTASPKSPVAAKGTDIYEAGDGFSTGVKMGSSLTEKDGKFLFGGSGQDMYPLHSAALTSAVAYKAGGETKTIDELSVYFAADITLAAAGTENWHGIGLYIGTMGGEHYIVRMQRDGGCHILNATTTDGSKMIVRSNHNPGIVLTEGGKYTFEAVREAGNFSAWINGKQVFADVAIGEGFDGRMGLMFEDIGAGAYADNIKCYFTDDVEVEYESKDIAVSEVVGVGYAGANGYMFDVKFDGNVILSASANPTRAELDDIRNFVTVANGDYDVYYAEYPAGKTDTLRIYADAEVAAADAVELSFAAGTEFPSGKITAADTVKEVSEFPDTGKIVKGADIYAAGDGFLTGIRQGQTLGEDDGKFVFGGIYQDYFPLASEKLINAIYKVNGEEKQIGELPIYFSADVTLATVSADPNDGWHGIGLLAGTKGGKTYVVRIQLNGAVYVLDPDNGIISGVSPETLASNGKYKLEMLRRGGKLSVWLNGKTVFYEADIEAGLDNNIGVLFACVGAGAYAENVQCYFTEDVTIEIKVPEPEGPDVEKGTDIFVTGDKFKSGIREYTSLTENDGKFEFAGTYQDYYPISSDILSDCVYKVDGEEKQIGELPIYFSADITLAAAGAQGWHGIGLLVGTKGGKTYVVRMQQDGGCHILDPDNVVASNHNTGITLEANGKYSFVMVRSNGKLSVWINGKTIFKDADIESDLDNNIGVLFACVGRGSYVENVQCYFTQTVTAEKVQKPDPDVPPIDDPEPDRNTETIITPVPAAPAEKSKAGAIAMTVIGCILAAGCIAAVTVVCVIRFKKKSA